MAAPNKIEVVLSLLDKATAPFVAFNKRVQAMEEPFRKINNSMQRFVKESGLPRIGEHLGNVASAAGRLRNQLVGLGVAGIGAGFVFKTAFIDVAAEFERFQTVLETIEGSSAKAKESMDWISVFAAKTPYELTEVTEAFVKLRAYGMNPTNGLLKTLGDTSAAMGKPLMQAVEAVADAITGENERLKEFGIRAKKEGEKIVYEYSHNGKTIRAAANASNRAQIQATLEAIWNQKYAGAMDKLSGTWGGMMSNLSDQWTRFAKMVMDSGPFQNMRTRLADFLARIDQMAESGELARIAEDWGRRITQAIDAIFSAGKEVADFLTGFAQKVGGFGNALKIVAAVMAGPLLLSVALLAKAFIGLGIAMLTTPFGWIVGAIAGVIAIGALLAANFDSLDESTQAAFRSFGDAVRGLWDALTQLYALVAPVLLPVLKAVGFVIGSIIMLAVKNLTNALGLLMSVLTPVVSTLSKITSFGGALIGKIFGGSAGAAQQAAGAQGVTLGAPAGVAPAAAGALGGNTTITNNAKVEVDFKNVPRGTEVRMPGNSKAPVDLSMGYAMATP